MKFYLYRFSLIELSTTSLFVPTELRGNKNKILNHILLKDINGQHHISNGMTIGFSADKKIGSCLVSKLGKKRNTKITRGPTSEFNTENMEDWPFISIVWDLLPDSQNIAVEHKTSVFPKQDTIAQHLEKFINSRLLGFGWEIKINPYIDEANFWQAAEVYADEITKLELEFTTPNVLNLNSNLYDANRAVAAQFGNDKIKVSIEHENDKISIPSNSPFLQQSVEIARNGGGSLKLKAKNKTLYSSNSEENQKTKELEINLEIQNIDESLTNSLLIQLFNGLNDV